MKNYSEMSDFEINRAVALCLGCKVRPSAFETDYYFTDDDKAYNPCAPHGPVENFNPCNSWADAGPIILANKITISAPMEYDQNADWLAYPASDSDICVSHPKPLLAAMIVFLMMQEGV